MADRLVEEELELVYGGGKVGLMGTIADRVLARGGRVSGVIPRSLLAREVGHEGLSRLHVVDSMHERKALMASLSDGFIALPGGLGTMEEICEMLTWAQLGLHAKPCGLLDVDGYYDPFIAWVDAAVARGFIRPEHRRLLLHERSPETLLGRMRAWQPVKLPVWIREDET